MTSEMTPADIRACTGGCDNGFGEGWLPWFFLSAMNGGGWGGFGGGGGILAWLPWLLFGGGFGGWGNNGGGFNQYATAASQQEILFGQQFNRLESKADAINNGICDATYALNNTINQGFYNTAMAMQQQGYEGRIATGQVGQKVAECCCDMRQQMAQNDYNCNNRYANMSRQLSECCCGIERQIERGFCDEAYRDATNTTAIVQNAHNDTDRILARLDAMETNSLRTQLAAERDEKLALRGALERSQLRYDIVNDLQPCPKPAYITCNPQTGLYAPIAAYEQRGCHGCGRWSA